MTTKCGALWKRAHQSLTSAHLLSQSDPAASVSRSYYAALYAVSCLFVTEGTDCTAQESDDAVQRELVETGRVSPGFGESYSHLFHLRHTADYDPVATISAEEAQECIQTAARIVAEMELLLGAALEPQK
jgi:uncharacterized protein (UPF0332 family)